MFLPLLGRNIIPYNIEKRAVRKKVKENIKSKPINIRQSEYDRKKLKQEEKLANGLEKLIRNANEQKLDRKILMNLINYEENDAAEIHLAIKHMTLQKLDDSKDKSPFRKLLTIRPLRENSDTDV